MLTYAPAPPCAARPCLPPSDPAPSHLQTQSAAPIVIDGKGHLLGRLASIVAKQLLNGQVRRPPLRLPPARADPAVRAPLQKVVVVRTELINVSGSFFRAKVSCAPLHTAAREAGRGRRNGDSREDERGSAHGSQLAYGASRRMQRNSEGFGSVLEGSRHSTAQSGRVGMTASGSTRSTTQVDPLSAFRTC